MILNLNMSVGILWKKMIKNCRGVKQCNNGINMTEKEEQRENFRILLSFTENDIYQHKEYSTVSKIRKCFKTK